MKLPVRDQVYLDSRYGSAGAWTFTTASDDNGKPLGVAKRIRTGALKVTDDLFGKLTTLASDNRLKDEAKAADARDAGTKAIEALAELRGKVSTVRAAREKVRRRENGEDAPETQLMQFLRLSEIRHLLAEQHGADPLKIREAYLDAIRAGDFAVCDAIEDAPGIWGGKPDADTMAELVGQRIDSEDPVLSAELSDLHEAEREIVAVLNAAEAEVHDLTGAADDPVSETLEAAE
jgi:hypothetical protein